MKGLGLTGGGVRGEDRVGRQRTVCCIFSAHSWQTEGEGMNEFKKILTLQNNAGMSIDADSLIIYEYGRFSVLTKQHVEL